MIKLLVLLIGLLMIYLGVTHRWQNFGSILLTGQTHTEIKPSATGGLLGSRQMTHP